MFRAASAKIKEKFNFIKFSKQFFQMKKKYACKT